jgi:hypothetical protein
MMDFEEALTALKKGYKVKRDGWNGKTMTLELQPALERALRQDGFKANVKAEMTRAYIYLNFISHCEGKFQEKIPWTCNSTDLLANDWELV